MAQSDSANANNGLRSYLRLQKSTFLISTLLVGLPWMLVSVPGVNVGGGGTTGMSHTQYRHGWPFTALQSETVSIFGDWQNGKYIPGAKPTDTDFDELAQQFLSEDRDGIKNFPEWRLATSDSIEWSSGILTSDLWPIRFWSSRERWPWLSQHDGKARRIIWFGLVGNVLVLIALFLLVALPLEYRLRRRGRHLSFSLLEVLGSFVLIGLLVSFLRQEYVRANEEQQLVDRLHSATNEGQGYLDGERSNSLPELVSQLIDHRSRWPDSELHLFRPIKTAYVELYPVGDIKDEVREQMNNRMSKAVSDATFPVKLRFTHLDRNGIAILRGIANATSVQELRIRYDFDLAWDSNSDSYIDDVVLDVQLTLPNAHTVSVWLQEDVDQVKQLRPFAKLSHLRELNISGVDTSGAKYLDSIREHLPENTIIDLEDSVKRSDFPKLKVLFEDLPYD